jgi:TonB-linked SusC/RagA family outer membrane protein
MEQLKLIIKFMFILTSSKKISILLLFFSINYSANAQSIQVSGKVIDQQTQEPLVGISLGIRGTKIGTTSDGAGNYTLNAPSGSSILTASYVGYQSQGILINNRSIINISMVANNETLDQVVVTALGIEKNIKSLGYSVATIDGSEVNKVQTPNIISALSGKIAGVDVGNIANGVAGSKRIIIRGASSLTGNNQPLGIIDGIQISTESLGGPDAGGGVDYGDGLTGINPDDIESISVLKGNAAAALYGSLASNGVILVTTKSGKSVDGKTNIDISSNILVDKLINTTDFQYIYGQSGTGDEPPATPDEAFSSSSWGAKFDGSPSLQFDGVTRPFSPVKDNYERFFNTGTTLTNTAAVSGSNAHHNYRVSVSDLRNKDIVPNGAFKRTSLNAKTSSKFGSMTADIVLNYTMEQADNRPFIGGNHSNLFYSLVYLPGSIDVDNLKPGYNIEDGREFTYAGSISNPYYVVNKTKQVDTKDRVTGSVNLKYAFTDLFYARGRITRDYYGSERSRYIPDGNLYTSYPLGQFDEAATESVVSNYELLLGMNSKDFGKFTVTGFLGGNRNQRDRNIITTSGNSFVVPGVFTFNNLAVKLPSTSRSIQKTNSLFGSMELSYNKYLYLTLTGRNDWFSTLPKENNNLFYPSASLSFMFSDAFNLPSFINFGKFRASTAQVSGDTGPYQLDLSYSLTQIAYGGNNLQYIGTSNVPNRLLQPLLSTDYEFGLEMDFFNNRLGFDASYYNRQTTNDIVRTAISRSTGFRTAILNVGKLENQGIEVLLRGTPVKNTNFSWNTTLNFSRNDNKIIRLGDGVENAPILLATAKSGEVIIQLEEGKKYGGLYGYKYQRDEEGRKVFNTQGLPLYTTRNDFLANGVYDKMLGFSNTFNYNEFSLYTLVDAKWGASIYSETNAIAYNNGKHKNTLVGREEGFIGEGVLEDGTINTIMLRAKNNEDSATPGAGSVQSYYQQVSHIAEDFIYDASFVKLREVSLSYRLPNSFINKLGVTNATVAVVARNLLTLYKDKNLMNVDPESSVASGNGQGIERLVYPITRNYGLTLKVGL